MIRHSFRRLAALAILGLAVLLTMAGPALASSGPEWKLTVTPNADYFLSGRYLGVYRIEAENVGEAPTSSAPVVLEDFLPAGLTGERVRLFNRSTLPPGTSLSDGGDLNHEFGLCPSPTECEYPGTSGAPPLAPGQRLIMFLAAAVPPGLSGHLEDKARVSGGGATGFAEASAVNQASPEPPFGLLHLDASLTDSSAGPYTQAGGHPYQSVTELNFGTYSEPEGTHFAQQGTTPLRSPKEIVTDLPAGLIADPQAVPTCSLADFFAEQCPLKTQVGTAGLGLFSSSEPAFSTLTPVYNLQPAGAYPGELGANAFSAPYVLITAGLRSGSDYGVRATATAVEASLTHVRVTLWGVPAAPEHDAIRGKECSNAESIRHPVDSIAEYEHECELHFGQGGPGVEPGGPAGVPETPFLTLPTSCPGSPLPLNGSNNSWEVPGEFAFAPTVDLPAVTACNQLHFEPSIEARPTTNLADAPSGLEFDLHVPQGCWQAAEAPDFETLCQSGLHEAVVKLPAGLSVNPSSGNGLGACAPEQIGLKTPIGQTPAHFTESSAQCPDASKIGEATVNTPLLHTPLQGSVYLAAPNQNPFGSLLAAYIVLEGEGLIIKLPGEIEADPRTGRLTGRFLENPQTPFEDFHLEFFGGAKGDLRTPAVCGSYETTSQLTPYSHLEGEEEVTPIAEPSSSFQLDNGGAPCPHQPSEQPNAPVFRAGTESPQAGAFTPFSFRLAREDGSQEIERIETILPPGLTGKLAGVGECTEAQIAQAQSREHEGGGSEEKASPACPAAAEVGTVEVASGAGPTPLYVSGKAYLAGPYKGAPLSLVIITPAIAGPFDLGTVVVRTALYVNQETAQIKAVSDQIPHILQGIPLDVRSITLNMNRPSFTLNPTSCEELGFTGAETSLFGNVAPLTQRFQVGGCQSLPFKPKLSISLKGGTKRSGTPALKAVLTMPPGNANVASAQVTLPHSEFLDQGHLENICTRVQFNEHACPATSIYGHAVAYSPLLDHPLEGPVYLRSSSHLLPDLAVDLEGQIQVVLDSKVDSVHESLRNTFEVVPDAPVSKFVLTMRGGKHSLIENSTDICLHKQRATGLFRGQNGKTIEVNPRLQVHCKGKGKHKHHGKKRHRRH